jgi:hypothetical protein
MKKKRTHISIILDRTGSMEAIRDDTIGGFNAFLRDQKEQTGQATLTLVQFDSADPYEIIHDFQPLAKIPELNRETYVPRASTPLLDTLGRGILDLERRLRLLSPAARPTHVVFVVITDGQENSSREFTKAQIEVMLREKGEADDWQFVFLSADLDAIDDALAVGIKPQAALAFDKTGRGTRAAFGAFSRHLSALRAGECDRMAFTSQDRREQDIERRRR